MVHLRCTSGNQQGNHLFIGFYYEYTGFGTQKEADWLNDARMYYRNDVPASEITALKTRIGL